MAKPQDLHLKVWLTVGDGGVPTLIEALEKRVTKALVDHQRMGSSDCLCGPQKIGTSFAQHQAQMVLSAVLKENLDG